MDESVARLYKTPEGYRKLSDFYDRSVEQLPIAPESLSVDTRFGSTHMLAAGPADGVPIIGVQGMAGSAILWHQQFEDYSRTHRFYALDTPGQPGRSAPNPPPMLEGGHADWLEDVLDGLGLESAHFVGVSLSGWYLLQLGARSPARVRSAVLNSPMRLARTKANLRKWAGNAMRPDTDDDALEDRLTTRDFSPSEGKSGYDRQLARAMALSTRHFRLGVGMGADPDASRANRIAFGTKVLTTLARPMRRADLAAVDVPVLVIVGEHELLYNADKAIERAAVMPRARVEIVEDAGHAALYDRPDVVNALTLDFIDEND